MCIPQLPPSLYPCYSFHSTQRTDPLSLNKSSMVSPLHSASHHEDSQRISHSSPLYPPPKLLQSHPKNHPFLSSQKKLLAQSFPPHTPKTITGVGGERRRTPHHFTHKRSSQTAYVRMIKQKIAVSTLETHNISKRYIRLYVGRCRVEEAEARVGTNICRCSGMMT
ncbi:hypothetical protein DM02DRAFT_436830 [Periconia macrospinosa]|uniref:Uncharacterized protein n=1 Tax=Periconia macrospinosa TaxID=97972 RepID=A0A2V1DPT1_9PLEO|nr:hypothetical protein DM02DRAFT_436830 [Periconia macrospinosa]